MKVKDKSGNELDIQCQEYLSGLYVVIYKAGRLLEQFGLNISKEKFLKKLRSGSYGLTVIE